MKIPEIIRVVTMMLIGLMSGQCSVGGEQPASNDRSSGQYCGPCCVRYILKVFGQTHDLDKLVREIQSPDLRRGATLESLSNALSHRGVYTLPVIIRNVSDVELNFPHPIILHLNARETMEAHYVVWLPSASADITTIWDPAVGKVRQATWDTYRPRLSGAVLLTSPDPLLSPQFAIRSQRQGWNIRLSAAFTTMAVLLLTFCFCMPIQVHPNDSVLTELKGCNISKFNYRHNNKTGSYDENK